MTVDSDHEEDGGQLEEGRPVESMDAESSEDDDYLDDEDDDFEDDDEENGGAAAAAGENQPPGEVIRRTYIPNGSNNNNQDGSMEIDGEELECDLSAYVMYHKATTGYPCLSFDVLEDRLGSGAERVERFPLTGYLVAGTQADKVNLNKLLVLKLSKMDQLKQSDKDEDEEDEESDDEDEAAPDMQSIMIPHPGCVNRIRARRIGDRSVAATFSELGVVHLWDLAPALGAIEEPSSAQRFQKHLEKSPQKPIFSFSGHRSEGFAVDWSPAVYGQLATGDCAKHIFVWKLAESGWIVDQLPLSGHTDSVEDLQWSPNEANILASCSVDRSIRIWDVRSKQAAAIEVPDAHTSDVNVLSWNRLEKAFIVSGGDDGVIKVWDLRQFRRSTTAGPGAGGGGIKPVATFKHHHGPITSVEWHPTDGTVFAASSDDNQISQWDLAVEPEDPEANQEDQQQKTEDDEAVAALPPQLLFMHQGQKEVKELHWHSQLPGVLISTALSGFDIFRTISV